MMIFKKFNITLLLLLLGCFYAINGHAKRTTITFIHTDHLGSPIAATNEDGSVKWREEYQPFGKQLTNQDSDNNVGFTGHKDDKDLGLTYMQARWYHPETGRFNSLDPLLFREVNSFNRYVYANNNPYKYIDPDGENPLLIQQNPPIFAGPPPTTITNPINPSTSLPLADQLPASTEGSLIPNFAPDLNTVSFPSLQNPLKGTLYPGDFIGLITHIIYNKIHGNSKASTKEQHLYMIQDADGNIKKIGVSGQKLNKNGTSPRANSQLKDGDSATVLESGIPGRANVLQKEGQAVEGLRKAGHELPDQKRPKI
ncbi:RHS repeat-associated core domain-containing protein [Pleionea litopenaei]|uniref:RHS repeat-associated core domain-containing protein n=1 Tax=Pleionea litopenaei TaxID=3070815 RepID=A0AA51X6C0_9GAMM|nr:RHS repeat-associated core domain-containing protein [Pleionea sp. HL-JVS1]WMS86694.1 RHS repeat-associated core domain-containing protein [Pleionea sp. HL-JVS1]